MKYCDNCKRGSEETITIRYDLCPDCGNRLTAYTELLEACIAIVSVGTDYVDSGRIDKALFDQADRMARQAIHKAKESV